MDGTVAYSAKAYGKAAVLLAMKLIQGHNVPQEVYSPLVAVTRENVGEFAGWK
jgi:ABC-type sugar transport system substrate-binding protein